MMRIDKDHVERLRKSCEIGFFQPCVVDKKNPAKVYVGRHRKLANRNWPEVYIDVAEIAEKMKLPEDLVAELIIFAGNDQRPINKEESVDRVLRMAKILEGLGVKKEHVCSELAKLPGMPTDRWIRELLKDFSEYKMESMVRDQTEPETAEALPQTRSIDVADVRTALDNINTDEPSSRLPFEDCKCKGCLHLEACPNI